MKNTRGKAGPVLMSNHFYSSSPLKRIGSFFPSRLTLHTAVKIKLSNASHLSPRLPKNSWKEIIHSTNKHLHPNRQQLQMHYQRESSSKATNFPFYVSCYTKIKQNIPIDEIVTKPHANQQM